MRFRKIKLLWQDQGAHADGEIEPSERKFRTMVLVIAAIVGPPLLFLLYYQFMFKGLAISEALDFAQLGRNISQGKGFVTNVIRELGLQGTGSNPLRQPELVRGPLYPLVLAVAFGIAGPKDAVVTWVSAFFYLLTIPIVYRLAWKLFDRKVALLTVIVFCVNTLMLEYACSGLPLTLEIFLSTWLMLVFHNLSAFVRDHEGDPKVKLPRGQLITAGVLVGLLYLTDTLFLWVMLPVAAWIYWLFGYAGKKRWKATLTFSGWFAILAAPLMLRFIKLGVNPFFGLRIAEVWMNTRFYEKFDAYRLMPDELASGPQLFKEVIRKAAKGIGQIIQGFPGISASWILAFFLPSLLFRFTDPAANRVRQVLMYFFLSLGAAMLLFGIRLPLFVTTTPAMLAFAIAYLFFLIQQAQLRRTGLVLTGLLVAMAIAWPLANVLFLDDKPTNFIHEAAAAKGLTKMVESKSDAVFSDLPEAVAWYGKRPSIYLPKNDYRVMDLRNRFKSARWLFLTSKTPTDWQPVYDLLANWNENYVRRAALAQAGQPVQMPVSRQIPENQLKPWRNLAGFVAMPPVKGGKQVGIMAYAGAPSTDVPTNSQPVGSAPPSEGTSGSATREQPTRSADVRTP